MPRTLKEIGAQDILERSALHGLNAACERVLRLLWDLQPHTSEEIDRAAGGPNQAARRGLARKHELIQAGWKIERLAEKRNGQFQFKLLSRNRDRETAQQMDLLPQIRRFG